MPSRPTKKMLIVPFVNPFSQKEESIGREGEGERAQLAAAAGGEGEGVRRLAGQVVPTPRAHCISSGEERRRKGEEEEMDSLKEEEEGRQSFPLLFLPFRLLSVFFCFLVILSSMTIFREALF